MRNHLLHKYNSFLFIVFLFIFFIGCSEDISNPDSPVFSIQNLGLVGLENTRVNQMVLKDNQLYAMTTEGIYVKDINSTNSFRLLGLGGKNIEDAVIFSENDIVVSFKNAVFLQKSTQRFTELPMGERPGRKLKAILGEVKTQKP